MGLFEEMVIKRTEYKKRDYEYSFVCVMQEERESSISEDSGFESRAGLWELHNNKSGFVWRNGYKEDRI